MVVVLVIGGILIALGLALALLAIAPQDEARAAAVLQRRKDRQKVKQETKSLVDSTSEYLVGRADEMLKTSSRSPVSERDLEIAGFPGTPGAALVSVLAVAVFVLLAVTLVSGQILLAILGAAMVPLVARIVLTFRLDRVHGAFANQLDEVLQIIAAALRAGHGFPAALSSVAQNAGVPAGPEFARIINQNRIGRDLIEAMSETADRMDSEDFRWVTEAVATHRETGGNLNVIIDRVATTIRERKELREEVNTLAAEGKYSGIILMIIPVAVGGFFFVVNPDYMSQLLTTTTGQIVLAVCAVLYVIGGFWIRAIVKVDF